MFFIWVVSRTVDVIIFVLNLFGDVPELSSDAVSVLSSITGYGSYFVGYDLILLFISTVFFWATFKIILGFITFIWKLLPFT